MDTLQKPQNTQITQKNPLSIQSVINNSQPDQQQIIQPQVSNHTPSPLKNIPKSMTASDISKTMKLLEGNTNTTDKPILKSYTLSDLSKAFPIMQANDHPGFTGNITNSVHVEDSRGGMPTGYDPKQNYNNFIGGQCTSYASWYWTNVLGKPFVDINGQGNAKQWPELAKEQGYTTSSTPQNGDIVSWPDMGMYGHVAIVQGVNQDGSINVSEMNYVPDKYTTRSNVSSKGAIFIH